MSIEFQDYEPGMDITIGDPTDPNEMVEKTYMNKLAELLARLEECLVIAINNGDNEDFIMKRGNVLDLFQDEQVQEWLKWMREQRRARFPVYPMAKEDETENE